MLKWKIVAGLVLLFVVLLVLVVAPQFVGMNRRAMLSEAATDVDRIVTCELAYDAAYEVFLAAGSRSEAEAFARAHGPTLAEGDWSGAWKTLGWRPDGRTRCGYWVELVERDFEVHAVCDIDRDGVVAEYVHRRGEGSWVTGRWVY